MRAVMACAALLTMLLAGCATEEPEDPPQLWGACPQWISGPTLDPQAVQGDATFTAPEEHQGRTLDRFTLVLEATGAVQVRAYDEAGGRLGIARFDPPTQQPFLDLHDETVEVAVFLSPVDQGTEPAPGPLRLEATGEGTLDVTATPWYRVCGT